MLGQLSQAPRAHGIWGFAVLCGEDLGQRLKQTQGPEIAVRCDCGFESVDKLLMQRGRVGDDAGVVLKGGGEPDGALAVRSGSRFRRDKRQLFPTNDDGGTHKYPVGIVFPATISETEVILQSVCKGRKREPFLICRRLLYTRNLGIDGDNGDLRNLGLLDVSSRPVTLSCSGSLQGRVRVSPGARRIVSTTIPALELCDLEQGPTPISKKKKKKKAQQVAIDILVAPGS